jgi:hypothetical protein
VGDTVAYTASVHNAGPDAVAADLTIELEHRPQAEWGSVPPEAAINGIFFLGLRNPDRRATDAVPGRRQRGPAGVQRASASSGRTAKPASVVRGVV